MGLLVEEVTETNLSLLLTKVGQRRESHGGAGRRAHDQGEAERMLARGLRALGLRRE
jgi:hypothetical protein